MADEKRYSISELAELTGISRRTVRYYVQRKLIPPPLGAGRGHFYTDAHVKRIGKIRNLQDLGFSLDEVESQLSGPLPDLFGKVRADAASQLALLPARKEAAVHDDEEEPSLWTRITVARGVEMQVESGRYRVSPARLKKLQKAVREILGAGFPPASDDEEGEER
jgi:DNA-binding transcriptional MerR regulator